MRTPARSHAPRRGALLAEVAFAAVLLMVALGLTLKLLGGVVAQRRAAALRQVATQAAANAMEAVAAMPREDLTPERLAAMGLDPEVGRLLPGGRLVVAAEEAGDEYPPGFRRVTVEVRWPGRSDRPQAPVRLVAWLMEPGGAR